MEYLRSQGISGTARQAVAAVVGCLEDAQHISMEGEAETMVQRMSDAWVSLATVPAGMPIRRDGGPSAALQHHDCLASLHYQLSVIMSALLSSSFA